ncbi:zinc transport system permease protein [Streptomyces sp. AmelKG-E11A]|nr:zinc transport system permease protein [Streptomyces sp. AmelKG-E11A]
MEILDYAFMQRALLAAVLVGITAPAVGIYLVQRRQALMGDGIGHVAMTGVGLGFLLSTSPVWMAMAVAVLGAVIMELIRWYGKTRGDIALAMLFYGGMAGGVMFINLAPGGSNANLSSYLFGSLSTVSSQDVLAICLLAAFVVLVTVGLRRQLFAVSQDEEFARVTGLPVRFLNLLTAVTAAVTVTVAMRVVGLLLVSALMVVPVAAAQQLTRSFAATFAVAVAIGVTVTLGGTVTSYYQDVPPGATIVLLTIGVFIALTALATPLARRRARAAAAARAAESGEPGHDGGFPLECAVPDARTERVPGGNEPVQPTQPQPVQPTQPQPVQPVQRGSGGNEPIPDRSHRSSGGNKPVPGRSGGEEAATGPGRESGVEVPSPRA